eukprot:TRINITY_DN788_c0_g1_i7.p1 TRINITY_DN788_c0_g1~~TRINITY_DN788_c0_g1_i7.p1  ORF type:complete len:234 (+),score=50.43 TRINITY_DN788_c0_g1_i7:102-704(+)
MGPSSMFFLLVGGLLVLSKVEASSSREGVDNSSSDSRRMFGCAAWCQWVPTASYQYVADCENCGQPYAGHPQTPQPVAAAQDFCIKASTCDECCNLPDSYCVQQECWMCQADKTSANCANCWAQKCMPECTKCYMYDSGSSSSSSVSEGSGRSPRGASIEGSGKDTSPISAGWSVAGGKGWVVTALSCASLVAGLHMGTA